MELTNNSFVLFLAGSALFAFALGLAASYLVSITITRRGKYVDFSALGAIGTSLAVTGIIMSLRGLGVI